MIKRIFSSVFASMIVMTLLLPLYAAAQTPKVDPGQVQRDPQTAQPAPTPPAAQPATTPAAARPATTPAPAAAPNTSSASPTNGGTVAPGSFVPLTNLPGLSQTVNSNTLPTFFNNLYKLCIGAAAVIAILQIMRAGTYFFFNKGSVAHNVKAKELITNSVLGLILVLSPAIIFGIINPDILHLNLDVSRLKTALDHPQLPSLSASQAAAACQVPISTVQSTCMSTETSSITSVYVSCISSHGDSSATRQTCLQQSQNSYNQAAGKCFTSPALNATQLSCMRGTFDFTSGAPPSVDLSAPTQSERCNDAYERVIATNSTAQCTATNRGTVLQAASGCCAGVSAGATCCGLPHPPPSPIDVIALGTQSGPGGMINVNDIYDTDKLNYTGFRDRCVAVNGVGHASAGNAYIRCPNQAASEAPRCLTVHLTCQLP